MSMDSLHTTATPARRRFLLPLSLALLTAPFAPIAGAETMFNTGLRAEFVQLRQGSDHVLERNQLLLSEHGMRLDQEGLGFRMLSNAADEKTWYIDRLRSVAFESPMPARKSGGNESLVVAGIPIESKVIPGLMDRQVCNAHQVSEAFDSRWRGRDVSISTCVDDRGRVVARQWFSPEVGVVIRNVSPRGQIEELRDIQPMDVTADSFRLDESLRVVDAAEFFQGSALGLDRFDAE